MYTLPSAAMYVLRDCHIGEIRLSSQVDTERRGFRFGAFRKALRVPDRKTRFLTPKCDERGVRREEDEIFGFGHAQQQAVERIAMGLRSFHDGQHMLVGYR